MLIPPPKTILSAAIISTKLGIVYWMKSTNANFFAKIAIFIKAVPKHNYESLGIKARPFKVSPMNISPTAHIITTKFLSVAAIHVANGNATIVIR